MPRTSLPVITSVKNLRGKRVLLRASLDVPIEKGAVTNYFRVMRAMPTLLFLTNRGAKVILITHVGRDPKTTVKPLHAVLKEHVAVSYVPALFGKKVDDALRRLADGEVLLLENLRSNKGEIENDPEFAKRLASYAEMYVDDAFAVAHRAHASIVGIPAYIKGYAGITFKEEYEGLKKALAPKNPSLFILGGAKFETKEPLVKKYIKKYSRICIGGALANDFLKAKGYEVGRSLVSDHALKGSPLLRNKNIVLPIDVIAEKGKTHRVAGIDEVKKDEAIVDIGPATTAMLGEYIKTAKTILWNGPLGYYEKYGEGTKDIALLIGKSRAHSVVGGGDTIAAIESLAINDKFGFLSTAGGAMLVFLMQGSLPGIEALQKTRRKR